MVFFSKKKKKIFNVLVKQQPRLRHRTRRLQRRKWLGGTVIAVAVLWAGWYGITKLLFPILFQVPSADQPEQLQVVIDTPDQRKLSDDEQRQLRKTVSTFLRSKPRFSPQQLADHLFHRSPYEKLLVLRQSPSELLIKIWQRVPVMRTMTDKIRLVTASGTVYGEAENTDSPLTLPLLTGLFTNQQRQFVMTSANQLNISPFEEEVLREAVNLLQLLQAEGHVVASLEFIMHRGFTCQLTSLGTTVTFGRAPFTKKISKLQKVLAHLADKGFRAQRIELDYIGKAFIKGHGPIEKQL